MGFTLTWDEYAEWLAATQGMDIEDAVEKALKMYVRQYGKLVTAEEVVNFWENRKLRCR